MATSHHCIKSKIKLCKTILPVFLVLFCLKVFGQTSNSDFERLKLFVPGSEFTGIAVAPDNNTIAVTCKRSEPIRIIDWKAQSVVREINAGDWMTGSTVSFSDGGKYLLLQEIGFSDFSQNKNRAIDYQIIDLTTGNVVKKFDKIQDVVIAADEQTAVSLNNNEITFWSLPSGEKTKSFNIGVAGNALALSHDKKTLAVSQPVVEAEAKSYFGKDKKGLKSAVKYKQIVTLFESENGKKIKTIGEFYDLIYNLAYLPDNDILLVFQTPDVRIQAYNKSLSYISLIDIAKNEPMRLGFTSMSMTQPDLKASANRQFFAINSKGNRFQEMHLYDFRTGSLEKRFELGHRLFEKVEGDKIVNGSRPAFIFLPDNQSILIAMGNQLIKWNIEADSK